MGERGHHRMAVAREVEQTASRGAVECGVRCRTVQTSKCGRHPVVRGLELVEVVNMETAEAVVVVVGEDEEQSRELSRNGFVMESGHSHLHNVWGK